MKLQFDAEDFMAGGKNLRFDPSINSGQVLRYGSTTLTIGISKVKRQKVKVKR